MTVPWGISCSIVDMSKLTEWASWASHLFGGNVSIVSGAWAHLELMWVSWSSAVWPRLGLGAHSLHTFSTHSHLAPACLLLRQKVLHDCIYILFTTRSLVELVCAIFSASTVLVLGQPMCPFELPS